jgi:hypothetical protein
MRLVAHVFSLSPDVGRIFHSQVEGKSRHRTDAFVLLAFPGARGELLGGLEGQREKSGACKTSPVP